MSYILQCLSDLRHVSKFVCPTTLVPENLCLLVCGCYDGDDEDDDDDHDGIDDDHHEYCHNHKLDDVLALAHPTETYLRHPSGHKKYRLIEKI